MSYSYGICKGISHPEQTRYQDYKVLMRGHQGGVCVFLIGFVNLKYVEGSQKNTVWAIKFVHLWAVHWILIAISQPLTALAIHTDQQLFQKDCPSRYSSFDKCWIWTCWVFYSWAFLSTRRFKDKTTCNLFRPSVWEPEDSPCWRLTFSPDASITIVLSKQSKTASVYSGLHSTTVK